MVRGDGREERGPCLARRVVQAEGWAALGLCPIRRDVWGARFPVGAGRLCPGSDGCGIRAPMLQDDGVVVL